MHRIHPFFSLLGVVFTAIILLGLALILWRSGGMAFSPGRLSAKAASGIALNGFFSHAEFESQCKLCHAPLETTQDQLCLICHEAVGSQIASSHGTHGLFENVKACASCHSDHHGADFDPLTPALDQFDHSVTQFSLLSHQVDYDTTSLNCDACHGIDQKFTLDQAKCQSCHQDHDLAFMVLHAQDFGSYCLECHDGQDRMTDFDHDNNGFPLDGKHAVLRCGECHQLKNDIKVDQTKAGQDQVFEMAFKNTAKECRACHAEPEIHPGIFETNCADCHTASGWVPAIWDEKAFDHAQTTGFSLTRHLQTETGSKFVCKDCHQGDVRLFSLDVCVACHSQGAENAGFMAEHQLQFGPGCLDCHDGVDRLRDFDHGNFFPLNGAHADQECEKCHQNKIFQGTPRLCVECHAEPAIHAGFFGRQCQNCHTEDVWAPARMRIHNFPLDHGGHGAIECKTCHTSTYVEFTCYGCHDHQPDEIQASHIEAKVSLEDLPDCAKCHPTGLKEGPKNP
jgi:hypothetical protein